MLRFVLAFCGVMLLGSIGAFFLFVPPVLIAAVSMATIAVFLLAFLAMFWAGTSKSPVVGRV